MSEPKEYSVGIQFEMNVRTLDPDVGGFGTLGCFARDNNNHVFAISNAHTLFPNFLIQPGLAAYHPDYSTCCSGGDKFATSIVTPNGNGFNQVTVDYKIYDDDAHTKLKSQGSATGSEVDCAVALLEPGVKFKNVYRGSIAVTGAVKPVANPAPGQTQLGVFVGPPLGIMPSEQQLVRILTRRGVIFGTLLPNARITGQYTAGGSGAVPSPLTPLEFFGEDDPAAGTRTNVNQLLILPRPARNPSESFLEAYERRVSLGIQKGDSGSVVIDWQGKVIGLLCRGYPSDLLGLDRTVLEYRDVGWLGVANPIDKVLSMLQVTIPDDPKGWSGITPSAGEPVEQPDTAERIAQRRGIERLRDGLRKSRRGRVLMRKIDQHHREVRQLFETVRSLSSGWRALHGPAFYHHCVTSVRSPGHFVPRSIDGITRQQLATELLPLLERHASRALARDIARYRAWATAKLLEIATIDEVPAAAAQTWWPT